MSDYIKREDAIAIAWCYVDDRDAICDLIRLPKADVVEVVRCASHTKEEQIMIMKGQLNRWKTT